MSSKSTNPSSTETTAIANGMPMSEASRQQFARSVDWMATAFRTAGALQQVNVQMSQRAALLHAQAAENARKASSPMELVQVQSSLLLYQWQELSRYSQELMLACSRALAPATAGSAGDATASGAAHGATAFTDAAMNAAGPMVQAWQQMFSGLTPEAQSKHH